MIPERICRVCTSSVHVIPDLLYNLDVSFGCNWDRWSTDDKLDHNVESVRGSRDRERMRVRKLFAVESMDSVQGTSNVVSANIGLDRIYQLCTGLNIYSILTDSYAMMVRNQRETVIYTSNLLGKCLSQLQKYWKLFITATKNDYCENKWDYGVRFWNNSIWLHCSLLSAHYC